MDYQGTDIETANSALARVIDGSGGAPELIAAARPLLPFTAAFCVVNRPGQRPHYLDDTYPDGAAKDAVQLYVSSTYLLNPVYNALLDGLQPGLYRMADLAPDNWNPAPETPGILVEDAEEIGYRTPGWPAGLVELTLLTELPGGAMGEISFARPASEGGFPDDLLARLRPFLPLFAAAFRQLWSRQASTLPASQSPQEPDRKLKDFARTILSPREAEVVQMILKGHSSLSISLTLGIALPTVKTHRKNAYAKLGISTQQQLFNAFLEWQGEERKTRT
ncbi:LuxR family transcriptional regulator [Leisingera sp. ANG-M1]|uniref:response regulator transcription factor n=1 Tax=Leisingera sp. ANG-M1 TaxID=1577895 RepID=UPI00057CDDC2|nr:LuxR C-terminal-related transcriptional regulator [Leisingera sp. ANG-M1]KIC08778.1 LuxR family transcriptional regulator [Leisingera sp. ANG-M1]